MKEKIELMDFEQGFNAIMDILENSENTHSLETVYDGRGHVISAGGKKIHKGYIKGEKKVKTAKDQARIDLLDGVEVVLNRSAAFAGKTGRNKTEGVVIRLEDADYTIKVTAHAVAEFANIAEDFVPEKNYMTRGNAKNHSSAIAKTIVNEIESNLKIKFGIEKPITLLAASASTIRISMEGKEYSFKITKKRSRVVTE